MLLFSVGIKDILSREPFIPVHISAVMGDNFQWKLESRQEYDVKGKSYFDSPNKYYSEDIGLRNARIGFRQQEMTHIMETIIYNELINRQFSVDVGVVYARTMNENGNSVRAPREIDFIVASVCK